MPGEEVANDNIVKKSKQKKSGLRSLQVLAAILLSHMGKLGVRDLLGLVAIVVSFPFYDVWSLPTQTKIVQITQVLLFWFYEDI